MPKFIYTGVTSAGGQAKGEIEARGRTEAIGLLRKKKIRALSMKRKPMEFSLNFSMPVKLEDISRFTRQFSAMTSAGLPLVECMDILGNQSENKTLSGAMRQVSADIQSGSALADSLAKHPKIFSSLYCNMVSAGEASGNLDGVLNRLAEYLEKADRLRRKIKGAMTYPAVLLIVASASVALMLTFVIPQFANLFTDLGGTLPAPTRLVMAMSDGLRHYFLAVVLVIVGLFAGYNWFYKTPKGALAIDNIKLKLPVVGDMLRKSAISRFSQTLSTLLSSGISILDALSITARTAGNTVIERGIMVTIEKITGGQTIAEPLSETGLFPPMVIHMISVGEKTGDISSMLSKIAQFYEEEVDAAVDALTSVLEPIMIVVLGAVIGGLLVAMYLPMFDLIGAIG